MGAKPGCGQAGCTRDGTGLEYGPAMGGFGARYPCGCCIGGGGTACGTGGAGYCSRVSRGPNMNDTYLSYSWHPRILRGKSSARHHLRRVWLSRRIHGLWRVCVGLLELLSREWCCVDGIVLGCRGSPGRVLRSTPGNELRTRLEAFRVVPALLVWFPLAAIWLVLG